MIVCGVDGGASMSRGIIVRLTGTGGDVGDFEVLAVGRGGSANANVVGESAAEANVVSLVVTMLARAGVAGVDVNGLAVGCSLRRTAEGVFGVVPNAACVATHDTWIAFRSGVDTGTGVVATAGTGSMVVRYENGNQVGSRGGWGWAAGDNGSAVDIGRRTVRTVLRDSEAGNSTPLVVAVAEHIADETNVGTDGVLSNFDDEIYEYLYRRNVGAVSSLGALAPVATRLAEKGDVQALGLVREATESLCVQIGQLRDVSDPVVLAGSVALVVSGVAESILGVPVVAVGGGLVGSVVVAAETAGRQVAVKDVVGALTVRDGGEQ